VAREQPAVVERQERRDAPAEATERPQIEIAAVEIVAVHYIG
jgi:hypothetical protein